MSVYICFSVEEVKSLNVASPAHSRACTLLKWRCNQKSKHARRYVDIDEEWLGQFYKLSFEQISWNARFQWPHRNTTSNTCYRENWSLSGGSITDRSESMVTYQHPMSKHDFANWAKLPFDNSRHEAALFHYQHPMPQHWPRSIQGVDFTVGPDFSWCLASNWHGCSRRLDTLRVRSYRPTYQQARDHHWRGSHLCHIGELGCQVPWSYEMNGDACHSYMHFNFGSKKSTSRLNDGHIIWMYVYQVFPSDPFGEEAGIFLQYI